jgi:hypothetical protein
MGMIWGVFKRLWELRNPRKLVIPGQAPTGRAFGRPDGDGTRNLEIPGSSLRDAPE